MVSWEFVPPDTIGHRTTKLVAFRIMIAPERMLNLISSAMDVAEYRVPL